MKGILITGGERPDYNLVSRLLCKEKEDKSYICAADSGLDYCLKNSINPDYILGDMDSLSDRSCLENFSSSIIEEHPAEKDFTDTELGLLHLEKKGCTRMTVLGGGGGRLDHLLAIVSIFDRPGPPDHWITAREEISHISDRFSGRGIAGEMISLFPVGPEECTMNSRGLKWPLDKLCWRKGDYGISNLLETENFSITMKTGRLILIRGLERSLQFL